MRIWTRKSASIQPRTSLGKSDVSWPIRLAARGTIEERDGKVHFGGVAGDVVGETLIWEDGTVCLVFSKHSTCTRS